MDKIKKMIIIIIVLIIIILISLIILKNINKEEIQYAEDVITSDEDEGEELLPEYNEKGFAKVDDKAIFFTITDCIQKYIDYINTENNILGYSKDYVYTQEEIENARTDILYNLLSKNYINKNNIAKENVKQYVEQINENTTFIPKEILSNLNYDLNVYIISGNIINRSIYDERIYIVKTDNKNSTFSIEPIDNKSELEKIQFNNIEASIENEVYNEFEYNEGSIEDTINIYTNYCRKIIINNYEGFYNNYLENNYKERRFSTLQSFKNYIDKDIESLESIYIKKHQENQYDNYTEYTCIDQYGNYYIFQEKGVMDFTVKLDTYTIDTEEFIEKYNNSSNAQKTQMNLDKIFQALNRHDYEYIYNKLDNTFKSNNFLALLDFENYMKNTFYNANKVEYGDFNEQSETYIYETKITDNSEENENILEKIFMMKLGEGTDFTISFNV